MFKPEGTYLIWIDFSSLGLSNDDLMKAFIEKGKLALGNGASYGTGGNGFIRLNVACPRSQLSEGLNRIKKVIEDINI